MVRRTACNSLSRRYSIEYCAFKNKINTMLRVRQARRIQTLKILNLRMVTPIITDLMARLRSTKIIRAVVHSIMTEITPISTIRLGAAQGS